MTKFLHTRALMKKLALALIVLGLNLSLAFGQQINLQGFWWDCRHNNYPNKYADYLTELAPRLKGIGVDAVWILPTVKNSGQNWAGYSPFDHYDIGDKYQKGFLGTKMGSKDKLLRMVGVLHSNGIDVIQDIVLNHADGAGSQTGAGGMDPSGWDNQWKNFRYTSFASPATDESATDYLSRSGRFSKNWQNFHSNSAHNCNTGDICASYWGPDVCYWDGAYGQSSNATFNPVQTTQYMRNNMRNWLIWYKKQEGFDGVRLDAVKHFETWATEDFMYNLQYNAGWASGGNSMFAVGEYVGGASDEDTWCNNVQNRVGTFDFALRGALYGIVSSNGNYDLGSIPGQQQSNRARTVPFVNNHDTFRPTLDSLGRITGWDSGNELCAHIDPNDCRLSICYAIAFAVDGSPMVFMEDLFDLNNGKRFTHNPKDASQLPVRSDIANLIWCRNNLNFTSGAYLVRLQSPDHLIIERSGKAIISVNDQWSTWQNAWVQTSFAPGTALKDYSGANGTDIKYVDANGWVNVNTPPCNGANATGRKGYAVWAPVGVNNWYSPSRTNNTTTQEWEMADDLGDSHPLSLQQGGKLPASSTAWRNVGRVHVDAGKTVTCNINTEISTQNITIELAQGSTVFTDQGLGNFTTTHTFANAGWVTVRIRNSFASNAAEKVWVGVTYTAPMDIVTSTTDVGLKSASNSQALYEEMLKQRQTAKVDVGGTADAKVYPNPAAADNIYLELSSSAKIAAVVRIYDIKGTEVYSKPIQIEEGGNSYRITDTNLPAGTYQLTVREVNVSEKLIIVQ